MAQPRVLIVTLFAGENELDDCVASARLQSGVAIVHEVIKNLPKQLAHQRLFEMFNQRIRDFDYFVKLDADMKFSREDSLIRLIGMMDGGTDLLSVSVWDGMTVDYMQSFNIFSNRCSFDPGDNDPLFTDRVPTRFPGRQVYRVDPERLVLHAFNPSPYQAFTFGVHRAMKVMQHGVVSARIENSYYQLKIINRVAENYYKNGSDSARLACLGAWMVMSGRITDPSLVARHDYRDAFVAGERESLDPKFRSVCVLHPVAGIFRLWGGRRFAAAVINYMSRKGFRRFFGVKQ